MARPCKATTKAGNPCPTPALHDDDYCMGHSPKITPEMRASWRRKGFGVRREGHPVTKKAAIYTRKDLLGLLSHRLDLLSQKYGSETSPDIEEMICNVCRTIAVVMRVEVTDDTVIHGWRMKGTA